MRRIIFQILALIILTPSFAWSQSKPTDSKAEGIRKNETSNTYFQNIDDAEFDSYENSNVITIYDPMEKMNRKIFSFNESFDHYFLEHVAKFYRQEVPQVLRKSIRNFLVNLALPISAVNSLAQGKIDNSLATISNFLINSTIGILGIFDVAGEKNIRYNPEDFGQTLGHYGMKSGAYIMLPILGPSSGRDFLGLAVDKSVNPLGFNVFEIGGTTNLVDGDVRVGLTIVSGIDTRESLIDIVEGIREDSFDPYATIRSAYLQKRTTEVKN